VKLDHKVQEVVSVLTSPSGYRIDHTFTAGEKAVLLDWEAMQKLPNREAIVVEYYEALPFDTAAVWKRVKTFVREAAGTSTRHEVVVEFLLRKMKARWPEVFERIAGKEPY
jgi:hypothetical protein